MKFLLALFFIIPLNIFSQQSKLMEFVSYLDNKHQKNQLDESWVSSEKESSIFLRKLYDAINENPKNFYKFLEENTLEHRNKVQKGLISNNEFSFREYLTHIKSKIAEHYSWNYVDAISIPYFLRILVDQKIDFNYQRKDSTFRPMVKIIGTIEEVIKGEKNYSPGNKISFYYNKSAEIFSSGHFERGKSYLVPLYNLDSKFSDIKGELIYSLHDHNICYSINNNIIEIPMDDFNLGKKVDWYTFVTQFKSKYMFIQQEGYKK